MNSERIDRPPLLGRITIGIVLLALIVFIVWTAFTKVDEIARGDGKIIPLSKTQVIQASEAGVIEEISVRVGQVVKKGELIVRLDDTTTSSSLGESEAQEQALKGQIARLRIEITGDLNAKFVCPDDLLKSSPKICGAEQKNLEARRNSYLAQARVLESRLKQREEELEENMVNIERLDSLIGVMRKEHKKIAPLVRRRLHPEINLLRLNREIEEQAGQRKLAEQAINRLKSAVQEARLETGAASFQVIQNARSDLSEAEASLGIINATIKGASDRVRRTDIRSPVDGIVNTLEVNTVGSFVQPGTVVAEIVPTTETLLVEAQISPRDVAFVLPGQEALVKITAYDFSIFGGLDGVVDNVSADSIVDQETGETFYNVRILTGDSTLGKSGKIHEIRPGMVASVDILTGRKSVLDYLLKPIAKARQEALTER
ncbi:MAG: HlyD family type I secretion periplasmic adaptor subunit [Hyphomicrobiales bacterium]